MLAETGFRAYCASPAMLTRALLDFTLIGVEWVLWLLVLLSLVSFAVMIERFIYFVSRSQMADDRLIETLRSGEFAAVRDRLASDRGMLPEMLRAGLDHVDDGAEAVESVLAGEIARSRTGYDRFLAFLGTLGNNAPFIGLFGTVLGIIRAFADLASAQGKGGADVVMAGISEALVATAVGLIVALPAVVAYNVFARWLRRISANSIAAGQALLTGLHVRAAKG